ncbi:hypothetical protein HYFRA_00008166 [Hymenoscyphus fraxineus]|uniref:Uncharacterized protein n=1 Tax=Hymenoscyphus fraxineus TaxID=746836 RepID=A0A9N9LBI9_9HELO|nr:hypothetical protein HYFRA_00008166 [Hymenoscyphus fraxineus]
MCITKFLQFQLCGHIQKCPIERCIYGRFHPHLDPVKYCPWHRKITALRYKKCDTCLAQEAKEDTRLSRRGGVPNDGGRITDQYKSTTSTILDKLFGHSTRYRQQEPSNKIIEPIAVSVEEQKAAKEAEIRRRNAARIAALIGLEFWEGLDRIGLPYDL